MHVLNELSVPVLAMGLHDVVIAASPEGIMGRVLKFTIPRRAVEIAEKAAFAEDSLSDAEIKMLHTLCREHMVDCSKSYTRLKKLLFRLLLINF